MICIRTVTELIVISEIGQYYQPEFKKRGPRAKWTIYGHVSDKSKKCLSVGSSVILSVVVVIVVVVVVVCHRLS